jgi:hypothetical protein
MIYVNEQGNISSIKQPGYYPVIDETLPPPPSGMEYRPYKLVKQEDYWVQTYKLISLPSYNAGEWLEMVGLGAGQQPTLIYLKLSLQMANKTSDKLNTLEQYLQNILAQYAMDPTPKADWTQPPISYHEAVQDAVNQLNS